MACPEKCSMCEQGYPYKCLGPDRFAEGRRKGIEEGTNRASVAVYEAITAFNNDDSVGSAGELVERIDDSLRRLLLPTPAEAVCEMVQVSGDRDVTCPRPAAYVTEDGVRCCQPCAVGMADEGFKVTPIDALPSPAQQQPGERCPVNRNCQGCVSCEPTTPSPARGEGELDARPAGARCFACQGFGKLTRIVARKSVKSDCPRCYGTGEEP